jgi:hypothetical protein
MRSNPPIASAIRQAVTAIRTLLHSDRDSGSDGGALWGRLAWRVQEITAPCGRRPIGKDLKKQKTRGRFPARVRVSGKSAKFLLLRLAFSRFR